MYTEDICSPIWLPEICDVSVVEIEADNEREGKMPSLLLNETNKPDSNLTIDPSGDRIYFGILIIL
tara:strand:- start:5844 stop:6041 length:198 start_codon:yes stop_codon:yes gene_type:complete